MQSFRLLKQTRQSTEYSCGACALQSVLNYWGKAVDEAMLMQLLHTNPDVGTYPDDIVRVARALGFEAEVKENLSLDDIAQATAQGQPVIVLGQAWRSRKDSDCSAAEDWENGHYMVALGVDQNYVYFEDPYVRMGKGFMPRQVFEDHWHNIMGGTRLAQSAKQLRLGIFIRGEKPVQPQLIEHVDAASLDFSKIGSLNLLVTQFEGTLLPYDFVNELSEIWETGVLRPDAFIFLRKDSEGKVSALEGGHLRVDEDVSEINALLAALAGLVVSAPDQVRGKAEFAANAAVNGDFGLSASDIHKIAERLPAGNSAVIVLFENLWERKFKQTAEKYRGTVINHKIIPSSNFMQLLKGKT